MKITLGKGVQIDLDKLIDSRALFQANSGGGKSWALRRFIEQSFGKKQIIIIDPEGEFGNMRTKYDFVYIGEGGDAPADPRSAALLARRLLETKANAIIDIYELGSRRGDFVKAFFDAVVNMPKELWTDCFFIVDEAHKFAPEKGQGESVALQSMIDMASLGRKRGYCLIPATQRPAKLSKDVVAELNNKLIGRASLDIDRERSAKELGFRSHEQILSLRDLAPGEFYVFGPAISNEIIKTVVGDVSVKPPKRGAGRSVKIAPPTAKVKAILKQLADLPQEAEKEARTTVELKTALASAKTEITRLSKQGVSHETEEALQKKWYELGVAAAKQAHKGEIITLVNEVKRVNSLMKKIHVLAGATSEDAVTEKDIAPITFSKGSFKLPPPKYEITSFDGPPRQPFSVDGEQSLGKCERKVFSFLYENPDRAFTKVQLGAVTGYSPTSGGFNNALSRLTTIGLIDRNATSIRFRQQVLTSEQLDRYLLTGEKFSAAPEFWDNKLGACERKVYALLWENPDSLFDKESLGNMTGYSPTSGGFNNALSRLNSIGLIKREGGGARLNPELRDI